MLSALSGLRTRRFWRSSPHAWGAVRNICCDVSALTGPVFNPSAAQDGSCSNERDADIEMNVLVALGGRGTTKRIAEIINPASHAVVIDKTADIVVVYDLCHLDIL
jgi:homoaconitase/3-isopropylmalate dehydratase large subunit